jgi:hypothetical protein
LLKLEKEKFRQELWHEVTYVEPEERIKLLDFYRCLKEADDKTYFIFAQLLDVVLSKLVIKEDELNLYSFACYLIADKFNRACYIQNSGYFLFPTMKILQAEKQILDAINYQLSSKLI